MNYKDDKFLGQICRDKVTQREGIVTSVFISMYGMTQYLLEPTGWSNDSIILEAERLELVNDIVTPKENIESPLTEASSLSEENRGKIFRKD